MGPRHRRERAHLARAIVPATGLPFGRWRTLLRLQSALPLFASGEVVSRDSAQEWLRDAERVIAAFRRETGTTPATYSARSGGLERKSGKSRRSYVGMIPRSPHPEGPGRFSGTTFTSECAAITR